MKQKILQWVHDIIGFIICVAIICTLFVGAMNMRVEKAIERADYDYAECVDYSSCTKTNDFGEEYIEEVVYYSDGHIETMCTYR